MQETTLDIITALGIAILAFSLGVILAARDDCKNWVNTGSHWRHVQETKDGIFIDGKYTVHTDIKPDVNTWYKVEFKDGKYHLTSVKTNSK